MKKIFISGISFLFLTCFSLPTWAGVPLLLNQQGRVLDSSSKPLAGVQSIQFSLYGSSSGGSSLWSETISVTLQNGYYSTQLGASKPLKLSVLEQASLYLAIKVGNGNELKPRIRIVSVPYALRAHTATNVKGGTIDVSKVSIKGKVVIDGSGNWTGKGGSGGAKGDKGDKGDRGSNGLAGGKGDKGDKGPKGDKGDKGDKGVAGSDGAKGDKGDKGIKGDGGSSNARQYTVALLLRSTTNCPTGWNQSKIKDLRGFSNSPLYLNINEQGFFMGGLTTARQGAGGIHARLQFYARVVNLQIVCWKTFQSSHGRPYVSVFLKKGAGSCPVGHHYIPKTQLQRPNGGYVYLAANDAGLFVGGSSSPSYTSSVYDQKSGHIKRQFTTEVDSVCIKVMGVDSDPATAPGIYPVYLGIQDRTICPNGWTLLPTSRLVGSSNLAMQFTRSATVVGGSLYPNNRGYTITGGGSYQYRYFSSRHVPYICYRYYVHKNARPYYQVRTPGSGKCPSGYLRFSQTNLHGSSGSTGYISSTGNSLYIGSHASQSSADYGSGYVQHTFRSNAKAICLKMENVK